MLIIKQTTTQPSSSKSQVKVFINSSYTSPASQLPYKLENLPRSHVILQHPYLYTLALWRTQTLVTNSPVPSRHIPQTATRVCGNSAVRSRSRHVFCGARETERESYCARCNSSSGSPRSRTQLVVVRPGAAARMHFRKVARSGRRPGIGSRGAVRSVEIFWGDGLRCGGLKINSGYF